MIYALCLCADLLSEPALRDDAAMAARLITPEWIAGDEAFDLMSGSAGAILGLIALYQAAGDGAALETAVRCGDHLLAHRQAAGPGAAWRTGRAQFMTGLSHGAAGIALALLRLARSAGHDRFKAAADDAIRFENSTFDAAERNWPDFRYHTEARPAFMNTWCHGAPGIGMARLAGSHYNGDAVDDDVAAALAAVQSQGIGGKDGLCCGNLGRADLLLSAERAGFAGAGEFGALRLASGVIGQAREKGGYRLTGRAGQEFFDPSFFQGLAGIGYETLRIANPELLPSVLVWE
jgi:lantibiotic modifying enzyme